MNEASDVFRDRFARVLDWGEAHVTFEKAIDGIPPDRRGSVPPHGDHSVWQLIEHMRIAQKDLLDFCTNANYVHALEWPDDYWPRDAAPPDEAAWDASVAGFKADREELKRLARDRTVELTALVPTGEKEQTYLRALLLTADHNAYHLGQIVSARRALGLWG